MKIDKNTKMEIEEELRQLVDEAGDDQEKLHNILKCIGAKRQKYCITDTTMKKIAELINYEFTGPDTWLDSGEEVKVLAFYQEKGNFYKKLGLYKDGCIIQVGELMTLE